MKRIFLLPGELVLSRVPVYIGTILGSCVAVCLHSAKNNFGAMNHFLLPSDTKKDPSDMKYRYGDYSTNAMIEQALKVEPDIDNITARVYGGGAVVGHLNYSFNVGERNIEMALSILNKYKIRIIDKDLAGNKGRKIYFDTLSGKVDLQKIQSKDSKEQENQNSSQNSLTNASYNRKIKLLIVDDSPTVRLTLKQSLMKYSYIDIVAEAADAYEARTKILELNPDVITLDIIMPKMDGISFLKKLMVYYPKPIIIISSIAQENSTMRQRAQSIGAAEVIDKSEIIKLGDTEKIGKILSEKIKDAADKIAIKRESKDVIDI